MQEFQAKNAFVYGKAMPKHEMSREELMEALLRAKQMGFSDRHLAAIWRMTEMEVRALRESLGVRPVFKTVDTCAAEFEAYTPYFYSCYERPFRRPDGTFSTESEAISSDREKIVILGGGPNRIGQGIEFDYCCCHAVFALREMGYETIMVNSNPETVSTDYDTADRLYFEPLTLEDVLNICELEKPKGVIVQFGGQTPLGLALGLEAAGVPILGTSPQSIDLCEDRKLFGELLNRLGIRQPPGGTGRSAEEALAIANSIGYPVLVRPSYVLGGRAMEIVNNREELADYMGRAIEASPERPVLVDRFLMEAVEVDVDAVSDGTEVYIGGIMEHIEYAGIHSGDSACRMPPANLLPETIQTIEDHTRRIALDLSVRGLLNIQFAVTQEGKGSTRKEIVYVLEVNPRASRTVPFVSKATGVPLAKVAARCMAGRSLSRQRIHGSFKMNHVAVKEAVLPFVKFRNVDPVLGPEMRSTGEVMGLAGDFGTAYAKSQLAAGTALPKPGSNARVFISVCKKDREGIVEIARALSEMGFRLIATGGTRGWLGDNGIDSGLVFKIGQGRPDVLDLMKNREIGLVINTPARQGEAQRDEFRIRRQAVETGTAYITTLCAARAAVEALRSWDQITQVRSLQEYLAEIG